MQPKELHYPNDCTTKFYICEEKKRLFLQCISVHNSTKLMFLVATDL